MYFKNIRELVLIIEWFNLLKFSINLINKGLYNLKTTSKRLRGKIYLDLIIRVFILGYFPAKNSQTLDKKLYIRNKEASILITTTHYLFLLIQNSFA